MSLLVLTELADVQLVTGDDLRLRITVTDQDGAAANLTGMTGRCAVINAAGTTVASSPSTMTVTILDTANGIVQIDATGEVTATWPVGSYRWQLRLEDAGGRVSTPVGGSLHVRPAYLT